MVVNDTEKNRQSKTAKESGCQRIFLTWDPCASLASPAFYF